MNTEITTTTADMATEINRLHGMAVDRAGEALQYATEAGKLLLEVKTALPHGEFAAWIEKNLSVSVRQVQRYISVAQGKPQPIRATVQGAIKNDTVSHLEIPAATFPKNDNVSYLPRPSAPEYNPDEDEVAEMSETIRTLAEENDALKDRIAAEVFPASEEEKAAALDTIKSLRAEVKRLEIENRALVSSRDSYQRQTGELKRQCAMQRKQIEKQNTAAA